MHNENGSKRVLVTKDLPGTRWLDILLEANCRVEICAHEDFILSQTTIKTLMSEGMRQCHGVIGQLTEVCFLPILPSCVGLGLVLEALLRTHRDSDDWPEFPTFAVAFLL